MSAPLVAQAITPTIPAYTVDDSKTAKHFDGALDSSASERSSLDERNPFSDPKLAAHWREVYKKSEYESRSAFDPDFEWTNDEERRLVRKLDWRVCLFACVAFFALQTDRQNLSQAVADNLCVCTPKGFHYDDADGAIG